MSKNKKQLKVLDIPDEKAVLSLANASDWSAIETICQALANDLRMTMTKQIRDKPRTAAELSRLNYASLSTIVFNLNILRNACLITSMSVPSKRGLVRYYYPFMQNLTIDLNSPHASEEKKLLSYSMPVGAFVDSSPNFDCSYATKGENVHACWDNLYSEERFSAELFFAYDGWVTYAFPNDFYAYYHCEEFEISLEICSEVSYYDNKWKSDITYWINGIELFTDTCQGDYGDRRGKLNPDWWPNEATQYGEYKSIKINKEGVFLNGHLVNGKYTIDKLNIDKGNRLLFKLGNKKDAKYVGGFNIFGKTFGDYPQDIVLKATVTGEKERKRPGNNEPSKEKD